MTPKPLPEHSYLQECFAYDPDTGVLRWRERPEAHFPGRPGERQRWNSRYAGKSAGGVTSHGSRWEGRHIHVNIDKRLCFAHRIIWKLMTGADPAAEIDHKNKDGTDNRWDNLRAASRVENMQNTGGRRRVHHSLPKGAFPMGGKFQAIINANGKRIYLGLFKTSEEAHQVYTAAVLRLHGKFAPS